MGFFFFFLVPRRRYSCHGPICHEIKAFQSLQTACLWVLDLSLLASCWPKGQSGPAAQSSGVNVGRRAVFSAFASGAGSNEVFAWLLYSASVFLSLFAPKHFSFFHYSVASPLPHHQTIRRSFDFHFHGPWVASIRYSLRSDDKRYKAIRCGLFLPKKSAGTESEKWSAKYPNRFPHLALSK